MPRLDNRIHFMLFQFNSMFSAGMSVGIDLFMQTAGIVGII